MPDYLPTPVRFAAALVLGVFGLVVGPLVEKVQGWRNRHLWEGDGEPRGVVCPLCGTNHPGDLVCRTSVASFMREEAAGITEDWDYWRGYNDALREFADMIGGSDGR